MRAERGRAEGHVESAWRDHIDRHVVAIEREREHPGVGAGDADVAHEQKAFADVRDSNRLHNAGGCIAEVAEVKRSNRGLHHGLWQCNDWRAWR